LVWTGIEEALGDIAIDVKFTAAPVTTRVADPLILPICALIVTVPTAAPLASPFVLTPATLASDELHVTELLTSDVVPSDR
jgi:hypothetical protein